MENAVPFQPVKRSPPELIRWSRKIHNRMAHSISHPNRSNRNMWLNEKVVQVESAIPTGWKGKSGLPSEVCLKLTDFCNTLIMRQNVKDDVIRNVLLYTAERR